MVNDNIFHGKTLLVLKVCDLPESVGRDFWKYAYNWNSRVVKVREKEYGEKYGYGNNSEIVNQYLLDRGCKPDQQVVLW